jgi:hypothetical protein
MQLAQLDLFGVSRRFPSIRQLHRKDRKKQEKEAAEKKPEGRKDEGCGDANDADLRTMAAGSVNISAGPLYSLPAKKSANLPALLSDATHMAASENGIEAGRLAAPGNGNLLETRTAGVPESTVTPGALAGTLKDGLTAGASGGMAGSDNWAAAMAASGKFENSYMSLPAVKTTSGGGGSSRLHLFRDVNIVQ